MSNEITSELEANLESEPKSEFEPNITSGSRSEFEPDLESGSISGTLVGKAAKVQSFLSLLQITDSALPIGSYSHSWGLETFVQSGTIKNTSADSALAIANLLRFTLAPREGVGAALAYRFEKSPNRVNNRNSLATLNNYLSASLWVKETHDASIHMGERLLRLALSLGWCQPADLNAFHYHYMNDGMANVNSHFGTNTSAQDVPSKSSPESDIKYACHHCVAVGFLGAELGIDINDLVPAYLFASTTALVAALVKLVPLGHTDGQKILSTSQALIAELSPSCLSATLSDLAFAPLSEWAAEAHQSLYSRLFQS